MSAVSAKVRLVVLAAGLLVIGSTGSSSPAAGGGGGGNYPYYYGNSWCYTSYQGSPYYYTHYYYAPQQYYHVYYYPSYGQYAYYYNYHTKKYWGRYDCGGGGYSMLGEGQRSGDLDKLFRDKAFPGPTPLKDNIIPGSKGIAVTAPPALPVPPNASDDPGPVPPPKK
jgi:hypothetical protein